MRAGPASFGVWGRWQRKLYLFLLLGEGPQVARTARVLTALEVFLKASVSLSVKWGSWPSS